MRRLAVGGMEHVRGPAGAGKTLFAAHLAIAEAARRAGDVIYCLVEELPTELEAQLAGLTFGADRLAVPVRFNAGASDREEAPRVYAGLIDVPQEGEPFFGDEILRVIEESRAAGFLPKVVVVDLLSEGYRVGGTVSRLLADDVAKHAAELGLVMILTEEVAGEATGDAWELVADTVLDLALTPDGQRTIVVRKNRFGSHVAAPHDFVIRSTGGIQIQPRRGVPVEGDAAATLRALRQRLHVVEPVYRAALALHGVGVSETPEVLAQLKLAVDRAREIERMLAGGWSISDLDQEKTP